MNRRRLLKQIAAASALPLSTSDRVRAAVINMKIQRVRLYAPPHPNPLFNQSDLVATVETDAGITGIGEGGSRDTIEQCAGRLIGQNPELIERLWQDMSRSFFYPAGREKEDAIGALDLALWDIKGKAHGMPVHALLGGLVRNYCECYNTAGIIKGVEPGMSIKERAQRTIAAGYRAFRMDAASQPINTVYNTRERVNQLYADCVEAREGVGNNGDWVVDFHQRFDLSDAIRACDLIAPLAPFFVEDPVRTEAFNEDLPILRQKTNLPIAAGEEWGNRWDFNHLLERHSLDYLRATLPNVGGITEMKKIAAICETHFIGIVPHFTGPIATAAVVHCLGTFAGPVLMEFNFEGRSFDYLPECFDFRNGKLYPNDRPGLGIQLDLKPLKLISEVTERVTNRAQLYFRPDGSITNW